MEERAYHIPVLAKETIEALDIRPDGIYVDGTLGGGGHSSLIAKELSGGGRLIGIDRDEEAIEAAKERLMSEGLLSRATLVHDNYANIPAVLKDLGIERVNGILLDLGVSSHQLDDTARGFSYSKDAPLDMRMDRSEERTAKDIVNTFTEDELKRILRDYGEERNAARIAREIVLRRAEKEIETTAELCDIIERSMPKKMRNAPGGHPAKRTFQAIRIALNDELDPLTGTIGDLVGCLAPSGRLAVITFHSLEDRIVKIEFRRQAHPCTCPPTFPVCVCGNVSTGRVVNAKPLVPSREELEANPRAASAKLRVFEREGEE